MGVKVLTLLHLADELLVEETLCLLVQGAVDGDNVASRDELLKGINPLGTNLRLRLRGQRLVVIVQQLLAVKRLQATQDTLADAADGDGTDDLVLEVVLLLGGGGDVPLAALNLLVGGDKVADEDEDGHDDVLGHGDDVAARHLGDGDAPVCSVGGVEVDVVGADAGRYGDLELLGLGEAFGCEVAWVEAVFLLEA